MAVGLSSGFPMLFADATFNWGAIAMATGLSVSIILVIPALARALGRKAARAIVAAGYQSEGAEWPPRQEPPVPVPRHVDAPRPMSELEATLARSNERVVRANIQLVLNELALARRTINSVHEDGIWRAPIDTTMWGRVRDGLAPEKGFHVVYNATRDAYAGIDNANGLAHAINSDPRPVHDWELARLSETVRAILLAERQLTSYLTDLANS